MKNIRTNLLSATLTILLALFVLLEGTVQAQNTGSKKYWIYFKDKGTEWPSVKSFQKGSKAYEIVKSNLSDRALARRAKLSPEQLIDFTDLPVSVDYISKIEQHGVKPVVISRWLNAVSAFLSDEQVKQAPELIRVLPFVEKIVPVVVYHRRDINESSPAPFIPKTESAHSLDYGPSLTQLNLMQVPRLHDIGITGKGILIGMLDTGFRWKWHEALGNIKVIAEHDFINNRDSTANGPNDAANQDEHGTATLSTIGGFMPGKLIGAAYGASFILGKTEWVPTETRIEEDNWVAGIEWMESKGVDVVSSSLGYDKFDPDSNGYVFAYTHAHGDFDGRTAVTTRAAVMAARKGVVVVTAMGNEQNGNGIVGTMIAPADADSIISSGAVASDTMLASFSSTGPTDDGRIKPDVVAMGLYVFASLPSGPSTYAYLSGTSLSTPLTAGVAALVLSARPELTPIQVRDAIRNTAVHFKDKKFPTRTATYPNNFYGWGLVNAYDAAVYYGLAISNEPQITFANGVNTISTYVVSKSPINPYSVKLKYSTDGGATFSTLNMSLVSALDNTTSSGKYAAVIPSQTTGTIVKFYIEATDSIGTRKNPHNAPDSLFIFKYGDTTTLPTVIPTAYMLFQNYPNPFNPSTKIRYDLPEQAFVTLKVFDILGREVQTLVDRQQQAGRYEVPFDARNVSSGVYFYQLRANGFQETKRMIIVR